MPQKMPAKEKLVSSVGPVEAVGARAAVSAVGPFWMAADVFG